ncbi:MAG: UvrD-helicase domain-containing protein, partial [Verrucomicrobia bacterium]|nr:UvrD-helicase domain-containing protein [Verrucomicrobiota bacterium]
MAELTPQQLLAVEAAGDTLVMAGAGAGKTRTLVARCLAHALDAEPPVALDRILMVTFTEAAAAEMRQRIARELEQRAKEPSAEGAPQEQRDWIDQQLALLDAAPISTLHSFCLRLVRENFHTLGLDPQLAVLDEANAETLAAESLDAVFNRHYAGAEPSSPAVQQLILALGRGADLPIRRLVLRLHRYAQTLPAPESWFAEQLRQSEQSEPEHWRAWLLAGVNEWREHWKTVLDSDGGDTPPAHCCREILLQLGVEPPDVTGCHNVRLPTHEPGAAASLPPGACGGTDAAVPTAPDSRFRGSNRGFSRAVESLPAAKRGEREFDGCVMRRPSPGREQSATALKQLLELFDGEFAADRAGKAFRKENKRMFDDARFLLSLAEVREGRDPLAEDWEWTRGHLRTLLELAREFAAEFAAAKRELGALDFADLEQVALRLLCDDAGRPTPLAEHWRARFDLVLVDEYQDINAAQDKIIAALGRTGAAANRFLVGDVKQSIYRLRLA